MRWPALERVCCNDAAQDKTALQQTMEEVKLAGLSCLTRKGCATALAYGEKVPTCPQKTARH